MAVMPSLIFLLKLAWQHVTFKWKNRNQILTELEKEETAHFCVTLYGLIVNSCSLTGRMYIWHGEISKTQLSHVSRSGLLRRCFGRFPVQAVRSSFAILFQTSHLPYLCSGTASTGCILLCGTVSTWTALLLSLTKTFLSSCAIFMQAAAFSRHSMYKLHVMKNICFIYNQFAIEAIE